MKMDKEIITVSDVEIEKKFHRSKNPIFYKMQTYWLHIGYLDDDFKMNSLYIMLPKGIPYIKSYDGKSKWRYFLIKNYYLLNKYNDIWSNVSNSKGKEFDSQPVYNKKFMKTKIKSYGDQTTDFHDKETKAGSNYTSLAVIRLILFLKNSTASVFKTM